MTTRIASTAGLVLLSWVASVVFNASMLYVPGTPLRRSLEQIQILERFRSTPEDPRAGAAFDRFLELGRQVAWFEATLGAVAVGMLVACAARLRPPLAAVDLSAVIVGFALWHLWLRGQSVTDPALFTSLACFGVLLGAGELIRRAKAVQSAA